VEEEVPVRLTEASRCAAGEQVAHATQAASEYWQQSCVPVFDVDYSAPNASHLLTVVQVWRQDAAQPCQCF